MTIKVAPDYLRGIFSYLQASAELFAAFPNLRVGGYVDNDVPKRSFFVLVNKIGGGADPYVPIFYPRLEVKCYGSTEVNAMKVFRYVHGLLAPPPGSGFRIAKDDFVIASLALNSGPVELVEPTDLWPLVYATYDGVVIQTG